MGRIEVNYGSGGGPLKPEWKLYINRLFSSNREKKLYFDVDKKSWYNKFYWKAYVLIFFLSKQL